MFTPGMRIVDMVEAESEEENSNSLFRLNRPNEIPLHCIRRQQSEDAASKFNPIEFDVFKHGMHCEQNVCVFGAGS